ncbi:hypothetical protein ACPOL_4824 [Acidisarcina polymorpha]|uniref:Uncharacterized protein n=1 Tax=Acidisarcina polymorpha TaxID=2211140 RepID=A0A2Z5G6A6_9BACT|nr:hypothetical protein ACPOL_4824 [Acidisarcina polymorpha]
MADAVNVALAYVAVWVLCSLPFERAKWFWKRGRIFDWDTFCSTCDLRLHSHSVFRIY